MWNKKEHDLDLCHVTIAATCVTFETSQIFAPDFSLQSSPYRGMPLTVQWAFVCSLVSVQHVTGKKRIGALQAKVLSNCETNNRPLKGYWKFVFADDQLWTNGDISFTIMDSCYSSFSAFTCICALQMETEEAKKDWTLQASWPRNRAIYLPS